VKKQTNKNNNRRLFVLSLLISSDSRSASSKVDLIIRNNESEDSDTVAPIRKLIDDLERLEFGPSVSENVIYSEPTAPRELDESEDATFDMPPSVGESEQAPIAHVLVTSARPDHLTLDEAYDLVQSRIKAHILELNNRERFSLWVGLQPDLPERNHLADEYVSRIAESIRADFTATELRAFDSAVDRNMVRKAVQGYFSSLDQRLVSDRDFHATPNHAHEDVGNVNRDAVENPSAKRPFSFERSLMYGVIILVGAYSANWVYRVGQPGPPERDIIRMSAKAVDLDEIYFPTTSSEQAERYLRDNYANSVRVPEIDSATLIGVDKVVAPSGIDIPLFVFQDQLSGDAFPVFPYSYAFIQANRREIDISPQILRRIEDASKFGVRMTDEYSAIVWRHQDDILLAITTSNPDDMISRITIF
jgi:hypothetical protein